MLNQSFSLCEGLGILRGVDLCLKRPCQSCVGSGNALPQPRPLLPVLTALAHYGPLQQSPWDGCYRWDGSCSCCWALGRLTACHPLTSPRQPRHINRIQVPSLPQRRRTAPASLPPDSFPCATFLLLSRQVVKQLWEIWGSDPQGGGEWRGSRSTSASVPFGSGPGWGVRPCLRLSQGNVISLE